MFWTWTKKEDQKKYISWGQPRSLPKGTFSDVVPDFEVGIYNGTPINPEDSVVYMMQGDATLGMGDSIWLITYLRDIYRLKGRMRCRLDVCSSVPINKFYSNFLPSSINLREEYITKEEFDTFTYKLPAMYYWTEEDGADRSWLDNQSIIQRLYNYVGIEYEGVPDFGAFTNEEILYPDKSYYERLGIDKNDKYVLLQWHSSGTSKNLPPKTNIKLIKHILKQYGLKVYVFGRLDCLDRLEEIEGVKNISGKTTAEDVFSLAFNSEFIVSPDSAGIHLGEAFRIPAVGIMATLPPKYIANKYKIPAFMYGSGFCQHKPCGIVHKLPLDKCPEGTKKYCAVLNDIDLDLFDLCVNKSKENREKYRAIPPVNFYTSQKLPITIQ
jgi:hypothetical protein